MRTILIAGLALIATGCAVNPVDLGPPGSNAYPVSASSAVSSTPPQTRDKADQAQRPRFADTPPVEYVLVRAGAVGVTTATDDSDNTYIGLQSEVPPDLMLFDAEGRKLEACTSGRVIGVKGVHAGILLRMGNQNSFVAKNRNSMAVRTYVLSQDPDVVAVRKEIAMINSQMKAFKEAIRKADENSKGSGDNKSIQNTPVGNVADPAPTTLPSAGDTYGVLEDGTVLIRIFFAFGSRAVVRPDDGLLRLELEAKQAGSIQLVGYTDSVGSPKVNRALAQSRVEAIANFLVSRGISRQKISVVAAGETDFLASNRTWRGRAQNRRVEALFTPQPTRQQAE